MSARPEFLFIVSAWRFADTVEIMGEYIEQAAAFHKANGDRPAEREIVKAMISRQICLAIDRGDFDEFREALNKPDLSIEQFRHDLKEAIA